MELIDIKNYITSLDTRPSILIGNGLSLSIHDGFNYSGLFERAFKDDSKSAEKKIFKLLKTKNFEEVLRLLKLCSKILKLYKMTPENLKFLGKKYVILQNIFIETIKGIHPNYEQVSESIKKLSIDLQLFERVFTTNYDLILYWAMMENKNKFTDRIVKEGNGEWTVYEEDHPVKRTHVYFLHGGIHLSEDIFNNFLKIESDKGGDLLNQCLNKEKGHLPLYVAEGRSVEKVKKIKNNKYLNICLEKLSENQSLKTGEVLPLIIFGQSLNEVYDKHIIEVINRSKTKQIFYGIFNLSEKYFIREKIEKIFWEKDVVFFSSRQLFNY